MTEPILTRLVLAVAPFTDLCFSAQRLGKPTDAQIEELQAARDAAKEWLAQQNEYVANPMFVDGEV